MKIKISQPLAIQQLGSRSNQEDSIFPLLGEATVNDCLFILCDGMGGHESGEIASSTVCKTISNYILSRWDVHELLNDELLEEAVTAAYAAVDEQDATGQKKMGTTLTLLCFHKGGCTVAHIGDSRIYHLRPATKDILYRSRDHSLVYDLFEVGELSREELKTAKNKNVITRVIMAHQERPSKADIVHIKNIEAGDYFYLCSDGMLEQMDDKGLMEVFASDKSEEQKRSILVGETVDNADNHSAYIIRIDSVEHEEGDGQYPDDEARARSANKVLMAELYPVPAPPPPLPDPTGEQTDEDDVQVVVGSPVPPQPEYRQQPMTPSAPPRSNKGRHMFLMMAVIFFFVVLAAVVGVFFWLNNNDDNRPVRPTRTSTETTITREDVEDDDDRPAVRQQQQNPQTPPVRRPSGQATPPKATTPPRKIQDPNKTNSEGPSVTKPQGGKPQDGESAEGQQNSRHNAEESDGIFL